MSVESHCSLDFQMIAQNYALDLELIDDLFHADSNLGLFVQLPVMHPCSNSLFLPYYSDSNVHS